MGYDLGSDDFPILTAEQETELFNDYRAGDLEARDVLIKSQIRWVIKLATQHAPDWMPRADAISAATKALMGALDLFDPSRGVRFSTYLRKPVFGAVCEEVRIYNTVTLPAGSANAGSKSYPIHDLKGDIHEMASPTTDLVEAPEPGASEYRQEMLSALRKALRRVALTPLEKHVIHEHYFQGRSYSEIGEGLPKELGSGVTRQRIQQIHKAAIAKLKGLIKQYGADWIKPPTDSSS